MSSEAGGGDVLLRDRLARFLAEGEGALWEDVFPHVPWEVWAEQVLAEIEAAGYVIVERGRWEFVLDMAREEDE